jgi:hypothetical protein
MKKVKLTKQEKKTLKDAIEVVTKVKNLAAYGKSFESLFEEDEDIVGEESCLIYTQELLERVKSGLIMLSMEKEGYILKD